MPQVPKQRNITLQDTAQQTGTSKRYGKAGKKKKKFQKEKHATCLTTLLKHELNSRDIARFATQIKPVLQRIESGCNKV